MPAKRTLREIRRQNQMLTIVLDSAKRLGPGQNRIAQIGATLKKLKEYQLLPSWRRAYVTGYAEGASAVLALVDAGVITVAVPPVPRATLLPPPSNGHEIEALPVSAPAPKPKPARAMKVLTSPEQAPALSSTEDAVELLRKIAGALASLQPSALSR